MRAAMLWKYAISASQAATTVKHVRYHVKYVNHAKDANHVKVANHVKTVKADAK